MPERGSAAAMASLTWIGIHIGRWASRLLLYPITAYFLVTGTLTRRGSRLYLERLLGRRPTWVELFRHLHCFSATILDRVFLLAGRFEQFDVQVHGGQLITDQIRTGQGCLLLGAHLGSFEVLRAVGIIYKHLPVKVLMNTDHNQVTTRFFDSLNPDIAATIIPIRGPQTLLKVKESLDQGYLVGVLGDRVVENDKVARCRFLGAEADFPAGPMLLASLMKCPVILFFGLYRGANRYDIYFERLADKITVDRQQREQDIQTWTQRYAQRLEHYVRSAPYNWFNLYDFWATEGKPSIYGRVRFTRHSGA